MEEQTSSIIFNTLKSMEDLQKKRKRLDALANIQISWDEFKEFTPIQVCALLMLREDALSKLKKILF